jgi:Fe2+ transport system protein B
MEFAIKVLVAVVIGFIVFLVLATLAINWGGQSGSIIDSIFKGLNEIFKSPLPRPE